MTAECIGVIRAELDAYLAVVVANVIADNPDKADQADILRQHTEVDELIRLGVIRRCPVHHDRYLSRSLPGCRR